MKILKTAFFLLTCCCMCGSMARAQVASDEAVNVWARHAALQIMTFSYETLEQNKEKTKSLFTQKGYNSFYKAFEVARLPDLVTEKKLKSVASLICVPEIIEKTTEDGQTVWVMEATLNIDHQFTQKSGTYYVMDQKIMMRIKNDPNAQNDLKLGIDQWIATSLSESEKSVCGNKERTKARIGQLRREIAEREAEIMQLETELKAK